MGKESVNSNYAIWKMDNILMRNKIEIIGVELKTFCLLVVVQLILIVE